MIQDRRVIGIIAAAGSGSRMKDSGRGGSGITKMYLELEGIPILARTIAVFEKIRQVDALIAAVREEDLDYCRREIVERFHFQKVEKIIAGGSSRQESVFRALREVHDPEQTIIFVHDGARPLSDEETAVSFLTAAEREGAAAVGVPVKDTITVVREGFCEETPDRSSLFAMQTPQGARGEDLVEAFCKAQEAGWKGTDEASILRKAGKKVFLMRGNYDNIKVTTGEDISAAEAILFRRKEKKEESSDEGCRKEPFRGVFRTGIGYDVHRLEAGCRLILGGVHIPWEKGLLGHSDADVLVHAIMDALLGAAGLPDIGVQFPDADERYRGISSLILLGEVEKKLREASFKIQNIDGVIIAQKPKIQPFLGQMKQNLSSVLNIPISCIGLKATTTEGLGFAGREEGIAAQAAVSVLGK